MERSAFLQEKYVRIYKIIGVTAGVYLAFRYALVLFAPFVAAYLLAGAVRPVVLFLKRKVHIPTSVGAALVVFLLLFLLGTGLFFLGRLLAEQVLRLIEHYDEYRTWALDGAEKICSRVDGWFSLKKGTAEDLMYTGISRMGETVNAEILPELSKKSLKLMGTLAYLFAGVLVAFVSAVLMLSDREKYAKGYRRSPFYAEAKQVMGRLSSAGTAYLKTQGILMLLVATVCTIGFLFVKREYALLLGIGIAILDAFPILGSGIVLVPWTILCFLRGDYTGTMVLVITYVLCVLVREILEPKLLGDRMGIPPLYALMAVYVGVELFGVAGVILGPFGLVVIRALLEVDTGPDREELSLE